MLVFQFPIYYLIESVKIELFQEQPHSCYFSIANEKSCENNQLLKSSTKLMYWKGSQKVKINNSLGKFLKIKTNCTDGSFRIFQITGRDILSTEF